MTGDERARRPRSFSGAHPFRPQCVIDAIVSVWAAADADLDVKDMARDNAATITTKIDGGVCPRCDDPLDLGNTAGSRVTRCRCVPVCPACGADEAHQGLLRTGLSAPWRWPIRRGDRTKRRNKVASRSSLAPLVMGEGGSMSLLTDKGVSEVRMRPHPGGVMEFGYDDSDDVEEQGGR